MSINTKNKRIGYGSFDLLKGICVVIFVISHTYQRYDITQSPVLSAIVPFIMLFGEGTVIAFYMMGGISFKETSPRKMLKKTFSSLIVPYLWVMCAYAFLFPLVRYPFMPSWKEVFTYAIRYVAAFLLGNIEYGKVVFGFEIYWCTPMYFFLAMFIAMNLLNLILKIKNQWVRISCVLLCVITGNILLAKNMLLFCLASGLPAVGAYYLGYLLNKNGWFARLQQKTWYLFPLFAAHLLCCFLSVMNRSEFLFLIIKWSLSCLSALFLMLLNSYIVEKDPPGLEWLKRIGIYSYWIVCLHSFETEAIPWFMYVTLFPQHQLFAFILELVLKIVIFTSGCIILKKIAKWRYRRRLRAYGK